MGRSRLLLGPVVGQVTHNAAVVVVEMTYTCDDDAISIRSLSVYRKDVYRSKSLRREGRLSTTIQTVANADVDSVVYRIVVHGLPAATRCELLLLEEDGCCLAEMTVHTLTPQKAPSRYVGLSCNDTIVRAGNNPWAELVHTHPSDTVFVHLGDQVYLDGLFWKYVRKLAAHSNCIANGVDTTCTEKDIVVECEYAMRRFYRRTWTATPECCRMLAHYSNLMIADDHEIVNEYGRPSFVSSGCPEHEHRVADIAKKLFLQYQDALWMDSVYEKQVQTLSWPPFRILTYGDAVVFFLSGREDGMDSFLETNLPRSLRSAAPKCKNVLLCTAVPPLECAKFETTTWTKARLRRLYQTLYKYRLNCRGASAPFLAIMGGDWHLGVEATMRVASCSNAVDIPLVSVGPLTNFPDLFSYLAVQSSAGFTDDGGEGAVRVQTCNKQVFGVWNAGVVDFVQRTACIQTLPPTWKFWTQAPYYPILLALSFLEKETPDLCCTAPHENNKDDDSEDYGRFEDFKHIK